MIELELKPKPKNLARRERLNPDWPITIYTFDCWPLAPMPQHLWDTARLMQSLWNELCVEFEKASAADLKDENGKAQLGKEERKAVYAPLDLKPLRAIAQRYGGQLPSECYYSVVDRFLVTFKEWRKSPKVKGAPRRKFALEKINIPLIFSEGKPTLWLAENSGHAWAHDTRKLKRTAPEAYQQNGRFNVGIQRVPINLHVALHRRLPETGRIKRVSLVGRRETPFGWSWQLQVQVEHPALPALSTAGRVAGVDFGWRVQEDGLRIGYLSDSDGNRVILRLPFRFGNANAQRRSDWLAGKGVQDDHTIADWRALWDWQQRADAWKDLCKQRLASIPIDLREAWPEEARRSYGALQKMGVGGLRRLRRLLVEAGIDDIAVLILTEWQSKAEQYSRWIRGAQLRAIRHRDDHYRKIADWIAQNYDVLAWEGDLGLKEMAEDETDNYALENAKTYRHLASLSTLRRFIAEALKKHGRTLAPVKTAWTNRCLHCDGYLEPTSKLLAMCENGHQTDIDESASTFLCRQIETPASISTKRVEIPAELGRYLHRSV